MQMRIFWNLANFSDSSSDADEELLNLEITALQEEQQNLDKEMRRRRGSIHGRAFVDRK
jgi:hypothetical protein